MWILYWIEDLSKLYYFFASLINILLSTKLSIPEKVSILMRLNLRLISYSKLGCSLTVDIE